MLRCPGLVFLYVDLVPCTFYLLLGLVSANVIPQLRLGVPNSCDRHLEAEELCLSQHREPADVRGASESRNCSSAMDVHSLPHINRWYSYKVDSHGYIRTKHSCEDLSSTPDVPQEIWVLLLSGGSDRMSSSFHRMAIRRQLYGTNPPRSTSSPSTTTASAV